MFELLSAVVKVLARVDLRDGHQKKGCCEVFARINRRYRRCPRACRCRCCTTVVDLSNQIVVLKLYHCVVDSN